MRRIRCEADNLRHMRDLSLAGVFDSHEIESVWRDSKKALDAFAIPDTAGGVNLGDRRAIYYLVYHLMPSAVLEIGTHIGASTLHAASALHVSRPRSGNGATLTTVDIVNVNDPIKNRG